MENAPAQADAATAPAAGERMPPEKAAELLKGFIRCTPRRGYCKGTGVVIAIIDKRRTKTLCVCIEEGVKAAEAAREARAKANEHIVDLATRAEGLEPPARPAPPPAPEIPRGARERHALLERELAREEERHARLESSGGDEIGALEGRLGAARARAAGEHDVIDREEHDHERARVEAEAAKSLAGAELERIRARAEELRGQMRDADTTLERLANQAGQYSARRMTVRSQLDMDTAKLEAQIRTAKAEIGPNLKRSGDRLASLRYRIEQHLSRHPGLRTPPS